MPKRAPSPGLGDRLKRVRLRLGFTNLADFARKIGQNYTTYRQWELFDAAPSAETLKKTCRILGVGGWQRLFLWLCDGVGEPPPWLENPEAPIPEAGEDEDDDPLPPRPSVTGSRRVPIPWRALELLARQGREADDRKDYEEVKKIEAGVRELVWPDVQRRKDILKPSATTETEGEKS